ncbi:hypothetical protein RND81_12G098600 [Saponaria officinalis]|uniref:Protein yippee-like n=1 Tax=Saponaria officinalis TaxID=3572 RepID=A0AAW1H8M9_SAPOF
MANESRVYSCNNCLNPVAFSKHLLSKAFVAKSGRAAMFGETMNVTVGEKTVKKLMTGDFTVGEIYCAKCGQVLGWKYFQAHQPNQVYKEGKFILELAKLVKSA